MTGRRLLAVGVPLVVVFADVGAISLAVTRDDWGAAETIRSLFVTGPIIGALLVSPPAVVLARHVSSWSILAAAEGLIAGVIVAVLVAVDTSESSTAGIALIYIPLLGLAIAGAAAGLSLSVTAED